MIFSSARRPALKEENPMSTLGELGKALGEEWRTMGDEAKAEWNTKAEADKSRYEA